jgi:hypothetical protein
MKAPSFHIIDHVIYHTALDTADLRRVISGLFSAES